MLAPLRQLQQAPSEAPLASMLGVAQTGGRHKLEGTPVGCQTGRSPRPRACLYSSCLVVEGSRGRLAWHSECPAPVARRSRRTQCLQGACGTPTMLSFC